MGMVLKCQCFNEESLDHEEKWPFQPLKRRLCTLQRSSVGTCPLKNSFFAKAFFSRNADRRLSQRRQSTSVSWSARSPKISEFWCRLIHILYDTDFWKCHYFIAHEPSHFLYQCLQKGVEEKSVYDEVMEANAMLPLAIPSPVPWSVDGLVGKHHYEEM